MGLNSDELGEKGQAKFRELCADAKLVCNEATRDRKGWDFIVEFPTPSSAQNLTLDKRGAAISSYVQIKTMWNRNDRFRIRLSAAERLAKEPKPSFIYVLKVDENLTFVNAYFIHVMGDPLALILEKLRSEQAAGRTEINKVYLSISASKIGTRSSPTGSALRQAIQSVCSQGMEKYISDKAHQLENLGFELGRHEAKVQIEAGSIDELVDGFLGLRKLNFKSIETFESRFNIKLPMQPSSIDGGFMEIKPQPSDRCTVSIRESMVSPPSIFRGELFFPGIPIKDPCYFKALIKTKFFQLTYYKNKLDLNVLDGFETQKATIGEWMEYLTASVILSKGVGTLTVKSMTNAMEFSLNIPAGASAEVVKQNMQMLMLGQRAANLLQLVGAVDHLFSLSDLLNASTDILTVANAFRAGLKSTDVVQGKFQFESDLTNDLAPINLLYIAYFGIGTFCIVYAVVIEDMEGDKEGERVIWTSNKIRPILIEVSNNINFDYHSFVERAKKISEVENTYIQNLPPIID